MIINSVSSVLGLFIFIFLVIQKFKWQLLRARHCPEHFTYINSFNSYNNTMTIIDLFLFTDEEIEAQSS